MMTIATTANMEAFEPPLSPTDRPVFRFTKDELSGCKYLELPLV